jgi:phenylpropionate dioxygenase-like ring-hydroxylating dioxygenase large terminal subunit
MAPGRVSPQLGRARGRPVRNAAPRSPGRRRQGSVQPARRDPQAQYHLLWPNTTINVEAGPGNLSVDATRPHGTGRSSGATDYFFYEEVSDEQAREMMDFANQVGLEDSGLVEGVQRGLDTGMVPHGRLLLSSEHLIQHFQPLVFEALAES